MFTHLFNAMRPMSHRDPGVIAAALTSSKAMPAVIPDGIHVRHEILRIIYMARGAGRIILTTDKVSLAGTAPDAALKVGRERAQIVDGAARLPDGTLAGAIISMLDGIRLMTEKVGASVSDASSDGGDQSRDVLDERSRAASAWVGLGYHCVERSARTEIGFHRWARNQMNPIALIIT